MDKNSKIHAAMNRKRRNEQLDRKWGKKEIVSIEETKRTEALVARAKRMKKMKEKRKAKLSTSINDVTNQEYNL
jgi:hypothetical protein